MLKTGNSDAFFREKRLTKNIQDAFEKYRETQDYKTALLSTAAALDLSKYRKKLPMSKFACSVGNVSEEMLRKYIDNQG